VVEPLGDHDRAAFSCGVEALDRYLRQQATQDMRRRVAAVFVLRTVASPAILGYYTLSATGVQPADLPPEVTRRLPRYDSFPATLIGRLAVDRLTQGLGKVVLLDALARSLRQSAEIAALAVVVDALSDAARRFYEHFGFQLFLDREDRLYLPMKTIEQLLAE
jgi:hypothetical protein